MNIDKDTLESIWKHFREGGIKRIEVEHNEGDSPCKVIVTRSNDLSHIVTCDEWGRNMKRCEKCQHEES